MHSTLKLAVSGAADTAHCGQGAMEKMIELGREIARQGAVLITGATTGAPLWASRGAKEVGGQVVGISPAKNEKEHVEVYGLPLDYSDIILYTGHGYPGRDILLTQTSDGVFIGCGRIGTIHEFTVAFEDGKPIGLLDSGEYETDDIIKEMIEKSNRAGDNPNVFSSDDPVELVAKMIKIAEELKHKD